MSGLWSVPTLFVEWQSVPISLGRKVFLLLSWVDILLICPRGSNCTELLSLWLFQNIFGKCTPRYVSPWSSLVEGREQLYQPKSQKKLWNHPMHVLDKFFGFNINTTAFCFGQSSLHLLLLKSSMISHKFFTFQSLQKSFKIIGN